LTDDEETALVEAVRAAARQAVLPRFRRLDPEAITAKTGPDDLVTEADREAEALLAEAVARILPDALMVGEEACETDPALVGRIPGAARAVIVDPVDGTWNFARGLATFGMILAVTEAGRTEFGLLYDPLLDDWVLARAGGGAWFCRPGEAPRRLVLPAERRPGFRGFAPQELFAAPLRSRLHSALQGLGRTGSLRCSCHEYRLMAFGHAGFCLSAATPKPWDHAAGMLAVREAGGAAAHLDGSPYRPGLAGGPVLSAVSHAEYLEVKTRLGWLAEEERE